MPLQYIWMVWSLLLLGVWGGVFALLRSEASRREMLIVSAWTSLFGLTEPFFVPEYWNPPSLFELAHRTGFDLESIVFTFAIAGIVSVLYEAVFPRIHERIPEHTRHEPRHRLHSWAIVSGPAVFFAVVLATPVNPIYAVFAAAAVGGAFAIYCRPDLARKMVVSGVLFTLLYGIYFLILIALAPGYVTSVWNLGALTGILIVGIPLEELLFAFSIGFLWSGIYEHVRWYRFSRRMRRAP